MIGITQLWRYLWLLLLLFLCCHLGGRFSPHYILLVWLKVWHRTERGKHVGRSFIAVTEGLGELFHDTETTTSYNLIKHRRLYLGFVYTQEVEKMRSVQHRHYMHVCVVWFYFWNTCGKMIFDRSGPDRDTEGRSQISEWRSLICLLAHSYSFTCDILMCLVEYRFGNKRSALSFHRSFDGPKHSLHAIKFFSFSSFCFQFEIVECCDHLFVCHYWFAVCLIKVRRQNEVLYRRSGEQVFQPSHCSCDGFCTWIRGIWARVGGREEWGWIWWKIFFRKGIIKEAGFNQRSYYSGSRVIWFGFNGKNVQEARLLATFCIKWGRQCGLVCSLDAIQCHVRHSGSSGRGCQQKTLIICSCTT